MIAVGDDDGCWDIAALGSSDPSLDGSEDISRLGGCVILVVGWLDGSSLVLSLDGIADSS